jgi:hypothetical protein
MPGHVEGQHAEVARDHAVVEEMAILLSVGARGVEADERDALAGLLEVDAMRAPAQGQRQVAADDGLEVGHA